jgi:hypothetical protein
VLALCSSHSRCISLTFSLSFALDWTNSSVVPASRWCECGPRRGGPRRATLSLTRPHRPGPSATGMSPSEHASSLSVSCPLLSHTFYHVVLSSVRHANHSVFHHLLRVCVVLRGVSCVVARAAGGEAPEKRAKRRLTWHRPPPNAKGPPIKAPKAPLAATNPPTGNKERGDSFDCIHLYRHD